MGYRLDMFLLRHGPVPFSLFFENECCSSGKRYVSEHLVYFHYKYSRLFIRHPMSNTEEVPVRANVGHLSRYWGTVKGTCWDEGNGIGLFKDCSTGLVNMYWKASKIVVGLQVSGAFLNCYNSWTTHPLENSNWISPPSLCVFLRVALWSGF